MIDQDREAGPSAPPRPPSSRHPRMMRGGPLAASVLTHALVFGLAALATFLPGSKPQKKPPPPAVPVVVVTPPPTQASPPPRKAEGDLPVRAKPTPTPQPTATPTPRPTPTPSPRATPTPRPTPKATPTPTPEQRQFKTMRQIPYFKDMTDEELRKQKLPPGMTDWSEVIEMGKELDGLNWLFLPPETNKPPAEGEPQTAPVPQARPTPYEEVDPDGMHTLVFQQDDQIFTARWQEGDENVVVTYEDAPPPGASPSPSPSPEATPDPARTFEVPYVEDRETLIADILTGYIESLFNAPSPSP